MLLAVPTLDDRFCAHFGQCNGVFLCEVDPDSGSIDRPRIVPRHASGCESLPRWLDALAVQCVVAGGLGGGAMQRLTQLGIRFSVGHVGDSPEDVVRHYLAAPDAQHTNTCGDHDHEHKHCRH